MRLALTLLFGLAASAAAAHDMAGMPMPKGPVPTSLKGARQAMRGR